MIYRQIVIKLGTSSLTNGTKNLSRSQMLEYVRQIAKLHKAGHRIVMTSSGAIAAGREVISNTKTDSSLPSKQMLAAVGQVRLMEIWTQLFGLFDIPVGQILLTRGDFSNRQSYLNVRDTLWALLRQGIIPIVNENDTVATHETRVGDNDNLSALIANMVAADLLVLLTDQEGLYTADPRTNPDASLIHVVDKIDDSIWALAKGAVSGLGTGGMTTKLEAALLATKSGTSTVIAKAQKAHVLDSIVDGKNVGTLFKSKSTPQESRKRWLISEKAQGQLEIDSGAYDRMTQHGASLLPVGLVKVIGNFERGAVVHIHTVNQPAFGVGLTSYSSDELKLLIKAQTAEIEQRLGYTYGPEIVHRDNFVLS
ncbi:MAG: glutamate 5-kinase [Parachlamydiales bacterium]|nr:glutamate 5-kinase [Parachlamydiales bacterium]